MADGIEGAIDTLKEILSSPDAADTISSMLGSLGLGGDETEKEDAKPALQPELIMKAMEAYKAIGSSADNRVTLLRAVRPFMRESRRENVDTAIQLLTVLRLLPLLGEFKDLI